MKICFISDTHNEHYRLLDLEGDILVCCGDISNSGRKYEIENFMEWFSSQLFKYKIMIAGNHDFWFDLDHERNTCLSNPTDIIPYGVIYLNNESITIEGINFFGTPHTPFFHNWAFNSNNKEMKEICNMIPKNTDIIISHGPPLNYLDRTIYGENVGSPELLDIILEISPKIVAFGHIHECYGVEDLINGNSVTKLINASYGSEMNNPIIIDYEI